MSTLKFTPKTMNTIFGARHSYGITKQCKGMPGFAPEYYDAELGELVVSYKDHKPYWQIFNEPPNIEIEELNEINEKMKLGFVEQDFL